MGDQAIRIERDASSSTLITGNQNVVNVQYGLTGTPARFRGRVRRFLSHYLGAEDRPAPFGGRGPQLKQLDAWLADPEAPPHLLITAPAGRGKTALLVHWLQRVDVAKWPVAFVPISIRFETSRPDIFYQALAGRLTEILGKDFEEAKGDAAAVYKDQVIELLDAFAGLGMRCLLAIDGLDEATGWPVDTSVLPPDPIAGLRIIAGARLLAGHSEPRHWLRRLDWRSGNTCTLEVPPLDRHGIADVLREMGVRLAGLAGNTDLLGELERLTEGDPLLLRFYVEDLWENRDQATALRPEELRGREKGFGPYFKQWLDRQGGVYRAQGGAFDEQTIKSVLVILACAIGPLRLADLVHLVRRLLGSERIISTDSLDSVRRFLVGGPESGYALGHPKLGEYLRDDFFDGSEDVGRAKNALLSWGGEVIRRLNAGELEPRKTPPYLLQFYAQHLEASTSEPDRFMDVVEDGWCRAWKAYEGGFRGFAHDIQLVLTRLSDTTLQKRRLLEPATELGRRIRCVLCLSSILSIETNVPADLLAHLVSHSHLSEQHALHIAELQDDLQKSLSLAAIAPHLSPTLVAEALTVARAIGLDWRRASALTALAPHLPTEEGTVVLAEALVCARAIGVQELRAEALAELAPQMPPDKQTTILAEALAAARAPGMLTSARAQALVALAPNLPPALLAEALQVARDLADGNARSHVLAALSPHLPPEIRTTCIREALEAARAVEPVGYRAEALTTVAKHLPPEQRSAVLVEALEAARVVGIEWPRAGALAAIVPLLPPEARSSVLAEAREAAHAIGLPERRAEAMAALAPHLPPEERNATLAESLKVARGLGHWRSRSDVVAALAPHLPPALLAEAFAVVRAVGDEEPRSRCLGVLASHLPAEEQPAILAEALKAAQAIGPVQDRVGALAALAPHLHPDERIAALREVFDASRVIEDDLDRAEALGALAPYLPADERHTALAEGLEAARAVPLEFRAEALAALAPHLPPHERHVALAEALAVMRDLDRKEPCAEVLAAVAPYLPATLIAEAFEVACAIADEPDRVEALAALAPHMPPALLAESLPMARSTKDEDCRSRLLAALAPHIPPGERPAVVAEALEAVRTPREGDTVGRRAGTLAALAPHLPPGDRPGILAEALEAARATVFAWSRAKVLAALMPHMPAAQLTQALDVLIMDCARLPRPAAIDALVLAVIGIADSKQPSAEPPLRETAAAIVEVGRRWP